MVLYRRNYRRRYTGRSYRPYSRSTRPYSRYRYTRRSPNSKLTLYRSPRRSVRPYSRSMYGGTNRSTPFTTTRWGNKGTSRFAPKRLFELKHQENAYEFELASSSMYEQSLSELVLQQGVTETELIGRKVFQKYHTFRAFVSLRQVESSTTNNFIRVRCVLAWRQNKIGTSYDLIFGDPATNKSCIFDSNKANPYNLLSSYVKENNGTYHVVYDKTYSLNVFTKDSQQILFTFDRNRPITMEPTGNPGEYHDSNRHFVFVVIPDQPTETATRVKVSIISEIGFYDP